MQTTTVINAGIQFGHHAAAYAFWYLLTFFTRMAPTRWLAFIESTESTSPSNLCFAEPHSRHNLCDLYLLAEQLSFHASGHAVMSFVAYLKNRSVTRSCQLANT